MEQRLQDQSVPTNLQVVHYAWKVKSKVEGMAKKTGWVQKTKKLGGCY